MKILKLTFRDGRPAIALACLLLAGLLAPATVPAKKSNGERSELKLVIPPDRAAAAAAVLGLAEKTPAPLEVLFFDTKDAALHDKDLILRVRHKAGSPGQSTVKLRVSPGGGPLGDIEESITPEMEWTNTRAPLMSRSIDHKIPPDQYNAVLRDGASAKTLFNDKQRRLVEARLPEFQWESLIAHGPLHGEIWDQQCQLKGFPKPVTVESWHLQKGDQSSEILELSAKVTAGSETEANEMAVAFFQAAEAAGFGKPNGLTKTQMVLDFFRPAQAPEVTK